MITLTRPFEIKKLTESGQIAGYGSVFHVEDSYNDIVLPGAFTRSLKERMPKMLWQHDMRQPIGVWTSATEDEKGLYLEGDLVLGVPLADSAYRLLKAGALDGLSIGYRTKVAEYDDKKGIRKLMDVDLFEVSPVTFPANEEARIDQVKMDPREIEAALRDAGLSRKQAKACVPACLSALTNGQRDVDTGEETQFTQRDAGVDGELAAAIRAMTSVIRGQ